MRRIAVINQKGGVGKTTTAANVGTALSRRGYSVLVIDLDPQSHLSLHLGVDVQEGDTNVYHVLTSGKSVQEVRKQIGDGLWILPAHRELYHAESELVSVIGRETLLNDALTVHGDCYDFLIMDCPPSLGILSLNGLCAAEEVMIPMQAHFLALQGVGKLLETIELVQNRINPALHVSGVLLCMYEIGTRLGGEVIQDLKSFFEEGRGEESPWAAAKVFHTYIRRNIKLAESPSHGLSVLDYAPKSHGAVDYMRLAGELLDEQPQPDDSVIMAHVQDAFGRPLEPPATPAKVALDLGEEPASPQPESPPGSPRDIPDDVHRDAPLHAPQPFRQMPYNSGSY